jgi:molecular chaperone GrpE
MEEQWTATPQVQPQEPVEIERTPVEKSPVQESAARREETDWCDRALRLQAEMENFRKRQQQLAADRIKEERQHLLHAFLGVVDDLDRALQASPGDGQGLRQGVELTRRTALQLLDKEGVATIDSQNQPFDPNWHEAVATVDHRGTGLAPDTIVQVIAPGYRLDDKLLRPAKVVVAV